MKQLDNFAIAFIFFLCAGNLCFSQNVGINTTGAAPEPSAMLDVDASNKGFLPPRMTTAERDAIATSCSCTPAEGLMIFNTTTKCIEAYILGVWQATYCGCSAPPSMPGSISGVTSVCSGQSGEAYTVGAISGASSYTWTVPSGASVISGQGTNSIVVDFGSSPGNISVTANNSCGSSSASSLAITIDPDVAASVSITSDPVGGLVCPGANITFTATPVNGGTPSYQWKVNSSNVGTNSDTYASSALVDGDDVECVMTSTASCVTGSPATSNTITISNNTGNEWVYGHDFNSLSDGGLGGQDGWSYVGLQGAIDVTTGGTPYEGTKHVLFSGSTSGSSSIETSFTGVANGTMYISLKGTSTTGYVLVGIRDNSDNLGPHFGLNGGYVTLYTPSETHLQTFDANTYYRVGIQFETGSGGWEGLAPDTYRVKIDNGAWSAPQSFMAASGDITSIRIYSYSPSGQIWYVDAISPCE